MSKLIVIEGLDGSGKKTQTNLLVKRLRDEGIDVRNLEYPDYGSKSSELVKMYLQGEISNDPKDINPYLASIFYTADRGISFIKEWKDLYENSDTVFIADRYTTSNMLYQASKLNNEGDKNIYLDWLWDLEFRKVKIPLPDKIIFLDINNDLTWNLTENRINKIDDSNTKDIHESDKEYQKESYINAKYLINKYGWVSIKCMSNNEIRDVNSIHEDIYKEVIEVLKWGFKK